MTESPAIVVMAKPAVPGRVKTRLMTELSAEQAAAVHTAMSACVLHRLTEHLAGHHVVAIATDVDRAGAPIGLSEARAPWPGESWEVVDQGTGDLGDRLDRVWRNLGGGPVVFFGVDSPDVPADVLRAIPGALEDADAAVGPVDDGGYWTLAARSHAPTLLRGIDWGGPSVYHQTIDAARRAGLGLTELPRWHDVDEPADLRALLARLSDATEPALLRLRHHLHAITGTNP